MVGIPASPTLSPWLLLRKRENLFSLLKRKEVKCYSFFGFARIALREGLKILEIEKTTTILVPSCICDVVVPPISELGVNIEFYRVLPNLSPDIEDINAKISRKTKGILIVNYFGFPQDPTVIEIAEERDLFLIEDNAHSFLSEKDSRLLGTFGDIGIATLRKTLPVPDGSVLFVNNEDLQKKTRINPHDTITNNARAHLLQYTFIGYKTLSHLCTHHRLSLDFLKRTSLILNGHASSDVAEDYERSKVPISPVSLKIANNLNLNEIAIKRRENYEFWLSELNGKKGIDVIFKELPAGTVPQVFPIIVKHPEHFMKRMSNIGVPVSHWPSLPLVVKRNGRFPVSNYLARHLVTLPVHQDINRDQLESLSAII